MSFVLFLIVQQEQKRVGKCPLGLVIKVIWGERHISEELSSTSPLHYFLLISLQFYSKWPRISNGSLLLLWPVFLTLAKKSPCVGYNIKKFGFVNNVRCAFLTEWVVDDDDRAFGVELLCTMSWCEIIQSCTLSCASKQTLIDTLWTSSKYYTLLYFNPDITLKNNHALEFEVCLILSFVRRFSTFLLAWISRFSSNIFASVDQVF